jgi:hypothetical protein
MAPFAVPAVLLLWLIPRLMRYRIRWYVELVVMPFAILACAYATIAIRNLVAE